MEYSDFLELNLPASNDYAGHWDVPANGNLVMIDDECKEIATELLTTPAVGYNGKLKGSKASLEARLNVGLEATGAIIYNGNDLDKSCHQMDGFETTAIHTRLANVDRREFVNARLRYLQQTVASGEYLNKIDGYDPTSILSDTDTSRYADNFAQRYGSQLFCFGTECQDPVMVGGLPFLEIRPMGWCSIGGRLFYHKNSSYNTMAVDGQWQVTLTEEPLVGAGTISIDNRVIRSWDSISGPCGLGSTTPYGTVFTAANIGIVSSGNNDWTPEVFQILRVEISSGVYEEYLIKSIIGNNSVGIYGEFPYAGGLAGKFWWVLDYTIPCVNLSPFVFTTIANLQALMSSRYYYENSRLVTHMLSYTHATASLYASRLHGHTAYIWMNPGQLFIDMSGQTLATPKEYFEVAIDNAGTLNITPYNIKRMTVLCMDKWSDEHFNTYFVFSIDPKLNYGAGNFISVVHPEIVRRMSMNGIAEIQNTWFDAPLPGGVFGVNTYLRVNCTAAKDTEFWTTDPFGGGGIFKGRQWWGVLIEYA